MYNYLKSGDKMLLVCGETNHIYGDRTCSRAVPRTWNKLPLVISQSRTLEELKKELKTYYFRIAHNNV